VELERNLLEVENDVGHILDNAGHRRELVIRTFDLDGGYRRARDGGQE